MLAALLLSFGVIFVAELGDKSQLMAMTFALKYRWWVVIGGITIATTLVHLVSVAVGHYLGVALPTHLIGIVGGVAFLVFGLWTLRGDSLDDEEKTKADRVTKSAFIAVASAFFLAELGDKTMLATVTLASDNDWVGVWIGSTLGMVAADALAIVIGATLGKHLPERLITLGAATLFFVFGVWLILEGLLPGTPVGLIAAAVVLVIGIAATSWALTRPKTDRHSDDEVTASPR
ncbi:TMEM165/GDT1 family protein [Rhodococcus sp. BP-349]|uniref:TMEM165/GDT1 family protein n=1 Tax=unclassified Rhodococcus (in: high G+C Gram-positive bacteria) TaxID=192944 RepID=UPI001C9B8F3B|nr:MULTISPECIES: TMEM165/GDT1 family protein [unclassified Rhodococcus (in: high G+C Gram-positive bacteria)]MBY6539113.1 TMEM165/GDT1 family protein [Rhodococcus sp. BP-363]MBY6544559.1 TMEM165/GDT1 family protein [Rhodococcus sp. BP-369]MBY6563789.1 TMEM165/GDT1 family protein [Rhodococcus sp. BP-370]MBY6578081.1 TMEM165/GDT1 family protein [Rhodococcus sp. BP-364]MBY6587382.1 TMEM165/GDT1 family protein [Rhodococcus sp. BP-358]